MKLIHRRALAALAILFSLAPSVLAQNCNRTSVGVTPLTDTILPYQGFARGLYPGSNFPTGSHMVAALRAASRLAPRDTAGNPSPAGRIVLLSIGMSNTTQEYSRFIQLARADPRLSPSMLLVDGAQGGQSAEVIANPNAQFWSNVDQRLAAASASGLQVGAVWLKEANARPSEGFPGAAARLQGHLETIAQILKARFPNLALTYLSSRIYAGYATTTLNPEPYAYEGGFAVKWLIADQIGGKPSLNFDPAKGPVQASLLLWGPYLWADGLVPRADGLTWLCTDFQSDGTHPSTAGRQKVAQLLLDHFTSDPTATPWFVRGRGTLCSAIADVQTVGAGTSGTTAPELTATRLPSLPGSGVFGVRVTNTMPAAVTLILFGALAADVPFLGGRLLLEPVLFQPVVATAGGVAEWPLFPLPADPALCGLQLRWQAAVADPAGPTGIATLTPGLVTQCGN